MATAVIYARVSSTGERQSTARQVADLTNYASRNGLEVLNVYEEYISGAKRNAERAVLTECIDYAVSDCVVDALCQHCTLLVTLCSADMLLINPNDLQTVTICIVGQVSNLTSS